MKLKIVYCFLPMKTLLIHVELMTQTEITNCIRKSSPQTFNSFHLTHLTLYAWRPSKMNKTFQQTTYHINQYLEIRWEILDHLGWKSIPGPSKTSVPMVKTMNSEPKYSLLSLPQVSVQEKTFVSMLDLIRIGWINTFASALWTCVWTLYCKDTIIKSYLIIEIIDHIIWESLLWGF